MATPSTDGATPATSGGGAPSLLSLKIFLFFFFGGVGALLPLLPLHMRAAGLTAAEARIVAAVSPLVALLGPLIVGPLADRLAAARRADSAKRRLAAAPVTADVNTKLPPPPAPAGSSLKRLLIGVLVLAAFYYPLLLAVPTVTRYPARRPTVTFTCTPEGAAVLQERCMQPACHHWPEEKLGRLVLINCEYDCQDNSSGNSTRYVGRLPKNHPYLQDNATGDENGAATGEKKTFEEPREPPHICSGPSSPQPLAGSGTPGTETGTGTGASDDLDVQEHVRGSPRTCHVFTRNNTRSITVRASLQQATNPNAERSEWCHYPIAGSFSCHLPSPLGSNCRVLCDIQDPYTAQESVLAQSQCQRLDGDPEITFWTYLIVRCFADCFTTAALVLVDTVLVISTRDGAADLGRQLLTGIVGAALLAPLSGAFSPYPAPGPSPAGWPVYGVPVIIFSSCMLLAAAVLSIGKIPLGAPDWWWQISRPTWGAPKRAGYETASLFLVLALLGAFCSAIDSYLPWHLSFLRSAGTNGDTGLRGVTPELLVGLTVLAGVLPAVPLLWRAEALIHFCGYSNILITAFTFYIIRYTGLSFVASPLWTLVLEATEVFTLSFMWVTTILYFRHLMPRTFIATGQAIAVAAHFCIGRSLGALVGGFLAQDKPTSDDEGQPDLDEPEQAFDSIVLQLRTLYAAGAVAAAAIAVFYFIVYHCCVQTRCGQKYKGKRQPHGCGAVVSGTSSNGAYTPLRSNHNGNNSGTRTERY